MMERFPFTIKPRTKFRNSPADYSI